MVASFVANAEWLVPLALLLLQFFMKYLIAEPVSGPRLWESVLQTPIEIGFLALSFAATVLIREPQRAAYAFGVAVVYIIVLMVCVALWKISPKDIAKRPLAIASGLAAINYSASLLMLVYAIELLTPTGGAVGR